MENFASNEEKYFFWYLEELLKNGYVESYEFQPDPAEIIPKKTYQVIKHLKTKDKIVEKTIFQSLDYQPDYILQWSSKGEGIFFTTKDGEDPFAFPFYVAKDKMRSIIDVKGTFNQNNMHRIFSIQQRMIYHLHGIYVQKIITAPSVSKIGKLKPQNALFNISFLPFRYLTTDISGKPRTIRFEFKLFHEFVKDK